MSESSYGKSGVKPQARIIDYEITGVAPESWELASSCCPILLARQQLSLGDVDLIELNEALCSSSDCL